MLRRALLLIPCLASSATGCGDPDPVSKANITIQGTANTTATLPVCVNVIWDGERSGVHPEEACTTMDIASGPFVAELQATPFNGADFFVGTDEVFLKFGNTRELGAVQQRDEAIEGDAAQVVLTVDWSL